MADSRPLEPWFAFACSRIRAMSCFPVCLWQRTRARPPPPALCLPLLLTPSSFPPFSAGIGHAPDPPTPRHEPANQPGQSVLTRVTICTAGPVSRVCCLQSKVGRACLLGKSVWKSKTLQQQLLRFHMVFPRWPVLSPSYRAPLPGGC